MFQHLMSFLVALFAVANPFGNLAIFIGLTSDRSTREKKQIAIVSTIAIAIIMLITVWIGDDILRFFGISVPAFQLAGGLIIILLGLTMLHSKTSKMVHTSDEHEAALQKDSVAVVPLAIPISAGPGTMTTIILYVHRYPDFMEHVMFSLVALFITLIIGLFFYFSTPIGRVLGVSGTKIATRIMGLILVAIAMGMVSEGMLQLFPGLNS